MAYSIFYVVFNVILGVAIHYTLNWEFVRIFFISVLNLCTSG